MAIWISRRHIDGVAEILQRFYSHHAERIPAAIDESRHQLVTKNALTPM
jgi:hypothetical protein